MKRSIFFNVLFTLTFFALNAQDVLIEKYITLADFSVTGFKDIKEAKQRTLINLPFYLSGLSVQFSESSVPAEMRLKATYDPNKKSSAFSSIGKLYGNSKPVTESMLLSYTQKDALKKALGEHYQTPYTLKSSTDRQDFMGKATFITIKVLIAQTDVAAWEADKLTKFQFPVIEIKDSSPIGGKPTHSITFYQPMEYKGKKDYYSRYGWKAHAKIPDELVTSTSLRLKGNPKRMRNFKGSERQYQGYTMFTPSGLRASSWRWSFDETYMEDTLYWIDTLVYVRYDDEQRIISAKSCFGGIEAGESRDNINFTEYHWDAEGEMLSRKLKNGKEFTFKLSYVDKDQSQNNQDSFNNFWNQGTNKNGLIQRVTYQNNTSREYDYEGVLRVEKRHIYQEGKSKDTTRYEYDHRGRLTSERKTFSYGQFSVLTIQYDDEKKTRLEKYTNYYRKTLQLPQKLKTNCLTTWGISPNITMTQESLQSGNTYGMSMNMTPN